MTERPTESQTSILRALSLMNGKVVGDATSLQRSETLAAGESDRHLLPVSTSKRVQMLYVAALSRRPEQREQDRAVKFVKEAVNKAKDKTTPGRGTARSEALADSLLGTAQ